MQSWGSSSLQIDLASAPDKPKRKKNANIFFLVIITLSEVRNIYLRSLKYILYQV